MTGVEGVKRVENAPRDAGGPAARIPGWLGYGGLLPFVALSVLTWADPAHGRFWQEGLAAYGAVILSFVGALHWGLAMTLDGIAVRRRDALFVWSVMPCLLAWLALLLHSAVSDWVLVGGFLLHYAQDRRLAAITRLPAWYLPLRLRLSSVAIVCLAVGAVAARR